MKKRKIAIILGLLGVLFLLAACGKTQTKELVSQPSAEPEKSKIVFRLDYPEQVSSDEEFSVKIFITNEFAFPVTLSSITFPFSDFKFDGRDFVTNPNADILMNETKVLEYMIQKNMEDNLGSGKISSLMQFDIKINDPAGSRELSKREDFVLEFI